MTPLCFPKTLPNSDHAGYAEIQERLDFRPITRRGRRRAQAGWDASPNCIGGLPTLGPRRSYRLQRSHEIKRPFAARFFVRHRNSCGTINQGDGARGVSEALLGIEPTAKRECSPVAKKRPSEPNSPKRSSGRRPLYPKGLRWIFEIIREPTPRPNEPKNRRAWRGPPGAGEA